MKILTKLIFSTLFVFTFLLSFMFMETPSAFIGNYSYSQEFKSSIYKKVQRLEKNVTGYNIAANGVVIIRTNASGSIVKKGKRTYTSLSDIKGKWIHVNEDTIQITYSTFMDDFVETASLNAQGNLIIN